jgi:uncharacterized membrane protein
MRRSFDSRGRRKGRSVSATRKSRKIVATTVGATQPGSPDVISVILPSRSLRSERDGWRYHLAVASSFWARVRRFYLAGILVLAPTALTLWVLWSLFGFFDNILGAQLRERGISVFGLGFVLLNVLLLLLGWLTTSFLGNRAFNVWDRLMHRVPLANKIYATLRQIAELLLGPGRAGAFGRVAIVEFPSPGSWGLGFVTSRTPGEAGEKVGQKLCSIFIPSAVNPTTGFLLLVPEERVRYLDMTPEQAMKMIVSAGALVPPVVKGSVESREFRVESP